MKMRKLIVLLSIICSISAFAQTTAGYERLVLTFTDGTMEEIPLSEDVVLIPSGKEFIIKINGTEYAYDRSDLLSIKYGEALTGIEDVSVDDGSIKMIDNTIAYNGLKGDDEVWVYSIDGRVIATVKISPDDNHVNFSFLPQGVYIVKSAQHGTHKIAVR